VRFFKVRFLFLPKRFFLSTSYTIGRNLWAHTHPFVFFALKRFDFWPKITCANEFRIPGYRRLYSNKKKIPKAARTYQKLLIVHHAASSVLCEVCPDLHDSISRCMEDYGIPSVRPWTETPYIPPMSNDGFQKEKNGLVCQLRSLCF